MNLRTSKFEILYVSIFPKKLYVRLSVKTRIYVSLFVKKSMQALLLLKFLLVFFSMLAILVGVLDYGSDQWAFGYAETTYIDYRIPVNF